MKSGRSGRCSSTSCPKQRSVIAPDVRPNGLTCAAWNPWWRRYPTGLPFRVSEEPGSRSELNLRGRRIDANGRSRYVCRTLPTIRPSCPGGVESARGTSGNCVAGSISNVSDSGFPSGFHLSAEVEIGRRIRCAIGRREGLSPANRVIHRITIERGEENVSGFVAINKICWIVYEPVSSPQTPCQELLDDA